MTKYVLTSIIASSTFTSLLTLKPYTHIQIVPHLLHQWQWWRIPVWMASYSNAGEVLFACLAVYNLRGLERIFGSRKYAVILLCFAILTIVIPNIFLPYKLSACAITFGPSPSSIDIKSTQLPPTRSNTTYLLVTPIVHAPHTIKLYSPSGSLNSFAIFSLRTIHDR